MNKIEAENYFSKENQLKYFGASQFKSFMDCEAATLAEINGEYERETTVSLLVGSYVDAYFEGTLDAFKECNPEIFTNKGELRSNFAQANEIIARLERDEMFMKYLAGEKQVIKTGKLFGHDWKIKIDSFHPGKAIVDLKIMKDFEPVWVNGQGKVHFIDAWRYDIQGAIYQAIEGNSLPFYIAAATKEPSGTDLEIFHIPQHKLDTALKIVEAYIDRFADVKSGKVEPIRCGRCPYCKSTKVLTSVTEYKEMADE